MSFTDMELKDKLVGLIRDWIEDNTYVPGSESKTEIDGNLHDLVSVLLADVADFLSGNWRPY